MPKVHRIATEIQITSICAGSSPNVSIMRDELAAMQARRGQQSFASHHRDILHVMHLMQMLNQRNSHRRCDRATPSLIDPRKTAYALGEVGEVAFDSVLLRSAA